MERKLRKIQEQDCAPRARASCFHAQFAMYKETVKADMLAEISVAKKDALVRLVESESAPNELKQRALKIANAEDEAFALKQEISEVKMAMTQQKLSDNEKIAALKMDTKIA